MVRDGGICTAQEAHLTSALRVRATHTVAAGRRHYQAAAATRVKPGGRVAWWYAHDESEVRASLTPLTA
jgi:hypothetical protein